MTSIAEKTLVKLRLEGYMDTELTQSGIEKAVGIIDEGIVESDDFLFHSAADKIEQQQQVIDKLVELIKSHYWSSCTRFQQPESLCDCPRCSALATAQPK